MRDEAIHTEEYRGYKIEIYADADARNPWKEWDGNPPIAVYSDRSIDEYGTEYGNANEVPNLNREQIKANLPAILNLTGAKTVRGLLRESNISLLDYYPGSIADAINEAITEFVENQGNSDRLESLETLFNIAGIPALLKSIRGYSQGDYAEVLAIATPKFREAMGNPEDYWKDRGLRDSIQLFADWAYGNVSGFVVEDAAGNPVESVWGFYGDYDAEYGSLSEAKTAVDSHLEQLRKDHQRDVKTWIRNRVPLGYRQPLATR
jgi:hypothetical protein